MQTSSYEIMNYETFSQLRFLPNPMINLSDPEHYFPFGDAMQKEMSGKDCPSLPRHKEKTIAYSPSTQHVKKRGCDGAV